MLRASLRSLEWKSSHRGSAPCCYMTLGMTSASQEDKRDKVTLKRAFRKKAKILHPDVAGTGDDNKYREVKEAYDEALKRAAGHGFSTAQDSSTDTSSAKRPSDFYDHPHGNQQSYRGPVRNSDPGWNPTSTTGFSSRRTDQRSVIWIRRICGVVFACIVVDAWSKLKKFDEDVDKIHEMRQHAHKTGSYAGTMWGRTDGQSDIRPVSPADANSGPGSLKKNATLFDKIETQAAELKAKREKGEEKSKKGTNGPQKTNESGEMVPATVGISYQGYPFTPEGQEARRDAAARDRNAQRLSSEKKQAVMKLQVEDSPPSSPTRRNDTKKAHIIKTLPQNEDEEAFSAM